MTRQTDFGLWSLGFGLYVERNGKPGLQMEEASRRRAGFVERNEYRFPGVAFETAEVCAFLGPGLEEFHSQSLPGQSVRAGLCQFVGADSDAGGGGKRHQQYFEKRGGAAD